MCIYVLKHPFSLNFLLEWINCFCLLFYIVDMCFKRPWEKVAMWKKKLERILHLNSAIVIASHWNFDIECPELKVTYSLWRKLQESQQWWFWHHQSIRKRHETRVISSGRERFRLDLKAVVQYVKLFVIPRIVIYCLLIYSVDKILCGWRLSFCILWFKL